MTDSIARRKRQMEEHYQNYLKYKKLYDEQHKADWKRKAENFWQRYVQIQAEIAHLEERAAMPKVESIQSQRTRERQELEAKLVGSDIWTNLLSRRKTDAGVTIFPNLTQTAENIWSQQRAAMEKVDVSGVGGLQVLPIITGEEQKDGDWMMMGIGGLLLLGGAALWLLD